MPANLPQLPDEPTSGQAGLSRSLSQSAVARLRGLMQPPDARGDPVFAAPWEARAFGMAVALHERGALEWEEFQALLAREIKSSDATAFEGQECAYYRSWLAALESIVLKTSDDLSELDDRMDVVLAQSSHHEHATHTTEENG